MQGKTIRQAFLSFFQEHNHVPFPSSSLLPENDPTLLFVNAGMVQFKDVFTGKQSIQSSRITTVQKCLRAGGKHNDLDAVGKTARHHTFFEMLGNFSFGDYFKQEAITWSWELLINRFGIDPSRIICTIFEGDPELNIAADEESRELWRAYVPNDRILSLGKEDNYWSMGNIGPCGPCSEIHFYQGDHISCHQATCMGVQCECDRWIELWNLVFMQYEQTPEALIPLTLRSIDTGIGLERLTAVLQGKYCNYDTDLFAEYLKQIEHLSNKKYGIHDNDDISMRVIADHARACTFLIADGIQPEKTGREYVLRRIFRRAVRHGTLLGIDDSFMASICQTVIDDMGDIYPEISQRNSVICEIAKEEEARFRSTMNRGLSLLEEQFSLMDPTSILSGDKIFQLYDTYGFPEDLTAIIAEDRGFQIDLKGFHQKRKQAREQSNFSGSDQQVTSDIYKQISKITLPTEFQGYESIQNTVEIVTILVNNQSVQTVKAPCDIHFVANKTPFYGKSGGQVGDMGIAVDTNTKIQINNTIKPINDIYVHIGHLSQGTLSIGQQITMTVDNKRRNKIRANHSATHLLHHAIQKTLGNHAMQRGSLVTDKHLRFDFSHYHPLTDEEIFNIETWINQEIYSNIASTTNLMTLQQAKQSGATAMFGEKYSDTVRVVQIGNESLEFCGGTHVERTGDIGIMKIIGESGIAQGVRRITAVTQMEAFNYIHKLENSLKQISVSVKSSLFDAPEKVTNNISEIRQLNQKISGLKTLQIANQSEELLKDIIEINGIKILPAALDISELNILRDIGDRLRNKIGSCIILLAGKNDDQVPLLVMVSKDLTTIYHAGNLIKHAATVLNGRGGGRPDMAQGGGSNPSKIKEAFDQVIDAVRTIK